MLAIHNVRLGKEVRSWPFPTQRWSSRERIVAHPTREEFAHADDDHKVAVIDTRTGKTRWQARGHSPSSAGPFYDRTVHLAYSPEGDWLATGGQDGTVRLWRADNGKPGPVLTMGNTPCVGLHWSKGGFLAVAFQNGTVELYEERKCLWSRRPSGTWSGGWSDVSLCVADEGRTLFAHVAQHTRIYRWQLKTGDPVPSTPAPASQLQDARWLDGNRVLSVDQAGRVFEWDVAKIRAIAHQSFGAGQFALSADGQRLLWSDARKHKLRLIERLTGQVLRSITTPKDKLALSMALSPDGRQFALGVMEQVMPLRSEVWHFGDTEASRSWTTPSPEANGGELGLAYSAEGTLLLEWASPRFMGAGVLRVRDARTGAERHTLNVETPRRATFDATGRFVIAGLGIFRDTDLVVWDLKKPARPLRLAGDPNDGLNSKVISAGAIDLSPCERFVALHSGSWNKGRAIQIWERRTGSLVRAFGVAKSGQVLRFSPEGRRLISGNYDGDLHLWDVTGRLAGRGPALRPAKPDRATLELCWRKLSQEEAGPAFEAAWLLASAPTEARTFLAQRLAPVLAPDSVAVARRIKDLDAEEFKTRQAAERWLLERGQGILSKIEDALPGLSLEGRRRLERIKTLLKTGPEAHRAARAIFALEQMGDAGRGLLYRLAEGVPEAEITQLARASLERQKTGGTARRNAPAP
jgi:WD40 repeat protein